MASGAKESFPKEVTSKRTLKEERGSAMERKEKRESKGGRGNEERRISGFKNSLCTSSEVKK